MDASNVLNFISNNVPLVIDIALVIVLLICVIIFTAANSRVNTLSERGPRA